MEGKGRDFLSKKISKTPRLRFAGHRDANKGANWDFGLKSSNKPTTLRGSIYYS